MSSLLSAEKVPFRMLIAKLRSAWNHSFPRVPFAVPYWRLREPLMIVWLAISGRIVRGQSVGQLERRISKLLSQRYCIGVNLGRTAIELALRGIGCQIGDEVILPSYCCRSVLSAVLRAGCTPVFADVSTDLNIDPSSVHKLISRRTKAVIVPHMFGSAARIDLLETIAHKNGISLIDDAAQALGARLNGRLLGCFGDVGIISFGPGKTATATGGGVLVTNRAEVFERISRVRLELEPYFSKLLHAIAFAFFRWKRHYSAVFKVVRSRLGRPERISASPDRYAIRKLSNIDAALALIQLDRMDHAIHLRRKIAESLREQLRCCQAITPLPSHTESANTKCSILLDSSDPAISPSALQTWFRSRGIEVWTGYKPLHRLPEMSQFKKGNLSRTEELSRRLVCLPTDPSMRVADVNHIVQCCAMFLSSKLLIESDPVHCINPRRV